MYIRHVDKDEQKIEMWLWPDPAKYAEVEEQMVHLLKGLLTHLSVISKLPKQEAMDALTLLNFHFILSIMETPGGPISPPNQN
ncbi:MAG: hypothetical protein HZA35_03270 [Parcubacteria group bacterium]|nr:hypothetical protein [Parcubacteria group bacterium]